MSQYFPKPCEPFGGDINVKKDLSNYATKADLKNATAVDTSPFAKATDLTSLKSNVDKLDTDKLKTIPDDLRNLKSEVDTLDVGKLKTTPVDLSKLTNVVRDNVVKKMYIMLRSNILKIKYLILLTYLLKLLLMLK